METHFENFYPPGFVFPNLLVLAAGVVKSMLLLKLLVAPSVPNGRRPPVPMDDGRLLGKLILYGLGTNQRLWINWICFDGRGKNLASTWYVAPSCTGRTGKSPSLAHIVIRYLFLPRPMFSPRRKTEGEREDNLGDPKSQAVFSISGASKRSCP